jgi:osmotically-inducible protein OsmY
MALERKARGADGSTVAETLGFPAVYRPQREVAGSRKPSDREIRAEVEVRLFADPQLDASDVEVTVIDGNITLDGTIEDRAAMHHAADIAETVAGVANVRNNLRLRAH